jgi:hypothetical protein
VPILNQASKVQRGSLAHKITVLDSNLGYVLPLSQMEVDAGVTLPAQETGSEAKGWPDIFRVENKVLDKSEQPKFTWQVCDTA